VRLDLSAKYAQGNDLVWWAFSSATSTAAVLNNDTFLGQVGDRTLFSIKVHRCVNIRRYSAIGNEDERLILPGTAFHVKSHLALGGGLTMIQLEEDRECPPLISGFAFSPPQHLTAKEAQVSSSSYDMHASSSSYDMHASSSFSPPQHMTAKEAQERADAELAKKLQMELQMQVSSVCACVCVCVCFDARFLRTHTHKYTHTHLCVCACVCVCVCIESTLYIICVCTYICMYVCIYIYDMYVCICMYLTQAKTEAEAKQKQAEEAAKQKAAAEAKVRT
jgi:hypothetical protein